MGLHPTCGVLSLQRATKLMAFVDMILGLIGIIWFVYMMGRYQIISLDPFERVGNSTKEIKLDSLGSFPAESDDSRVVSANHKAISLTLSATYTLVNLIVFVILLVGAHRKSIGLCLTWFYIRCSVFVFKIIILFMYIIAGRPLFSQIPFILFMFIHLYGLWVVNSYVEELRSIRYAHQLYEAEIKRKGKSNASEYSEMDSTNGIEEIQKKREEMYREGFQKL